MNATCLYLRTEKCSVLKCVQVSFINAQRGHGTTEDKIKQERREEEREIERGEGRIEKSEEREEREERR